jgi:hypothetical protein
MKRPHILALASALVIFGLGLVAGALAHRLYIANSVNASDDWRVRYVNEMHTRLGLTPQQVDKLNDVLDDTRAKVHQVHERYKPDILKIKQDQVAEIQSLLTPRQQGEYRHMVAEQEQRAKEQDARNRTLENERAAQRHKREQSPGTATK